MWLGAEGLTWGKAEGGGGWGGTGAVRNGKGRGGRGGGGGEWFYIVGGMAG